MSYRYVIAKGTKGPFFCSKGWTDNIWKCRFYNKRDPAFKALLKLEEIENRDKTQYPFVNLCLLKINLIVSENEDLSFDKMEHILKKNFKKVK